ncbi:MAG: ABC transporter permease, partial [Saprospiraceae bacterium]|nr:ABC transporter permease [Saprospiraceae bacterium]
MIRSYIRIALRNLWKYKGYTFINILGLAMGMASVILIMLYVQSELRYDRYHSQGDQIYRLNIQATNPQTGETSERWVGPYRLADELKVDFPDIPQIIRIGTRSRELITYQDALYVEENVTFVDPDIFQVLDFPLSAGDPLTALVDPFSVVVTEEIAQKYFGTEAPLGKVLRFQEQDFVVTGIIEKVPEHSQFQFDVFASINCGPQIFSRIVLENWGEGYGATFAMLPVGKSPEDYQARLAEFVSAKLEAWSAFSPRIKMQPLPKLYLHSKEIGNFIPSGDITYVYAFSFIALFILIIACINFMNLATARSSLRAREVGLRKVVGAQRMQLISQFLSESIVLSLLSLGLAMVIANWLLPFFNSLAGKEMELQVFSNPNLLLTLLGIAIFVGVAAGSYPALLLSGFRPVKVLGSTSGMGLEGSTLRKVLVTFQFASSILLLIVTGVVNNQLQYCQNMDLGFDKDHLVLISGTPTEFRGQYNQFRAELMSNPSIVNSAASSRVPPGNLSSSLRARPEGVPEDEQKGMQTVWTDFDF